MKAAVHFKYGSPDVLEYKDREKPVPGENELLIRVYSATVNRTDCAMLRAKPFIMRFLTGMIKPKKNIPGTDFAGVVEAAGPGVSRFKTGDRVFGFDDNGLCSHAEYLTVDENNALSLIPDGISFEQAAASAEGAHYAINFINKVELGKNDRVLVNGATGAIGSAAVQLLKYYNVHVTATCKTEKIDIIKSIGADEIIDYEKEDFTKSGKKFNFVFDSVGKGTFSKCRPLLERDGIYISSELGPKLQNPFYAITTPLTSRLPGKSGKMVRFPFPRDRQHSVNFIAQLLSKGSFNPLIDKKFNLKDIKDAFKYVETGEKTGNVIISMNSDTHL